MIAPEMPSEPWTYATSAIDIVPVQKAFSLFTRRSPKTDASTDSGLDLYRMALNLHVNAQAVYGHVFGSFVKQAHSVVSPFVGSVLSSSGITPREGYRARSLLRWLAGEAVVPDHLLVRRIQPQPLPEHIGHGHLWSRVLDLDSAAVSLVRHVGSGFLRLFHRALAALRAWLVRA